MNAIVLWGVLGIVQGLVYSAPSSVPQTTDGVRTGVYVIHSLEPESRFQESLPAAIRRVKNRKNLLCVKLTVLGGYGRVKVHGVE